MRIIQATVGMYPNHGLDTEREDSMSLRCSINPCLFCVQSVAKPLPRAITIVCVRAIDSFRGSRWFAPIILSCVRLMQPKTQLR